MAWSELTRRTVQEIGAMISDAYGGPQIVVVWRLDRDRSEWVQDWQCVGGNVSTVALVPKCAAQPIFFGVFNQKTALASVEAEGTVLRLRIVEGSRPPFYGVQAPVPVVRGSGQLVFRFR